MILNIKWLKNLPHFNNLEHFEQLHLLKSSWRELFLLSAIQYDFPGDLNELLNNLGLNEMLDKQNNSQIHNSNGLNDKNDKNVNNNQLNNHQLTNDNSNHDQIDISIKDEIRDKCSSPPSKKFMNSLTYDNNGNMKSIKVNQSNVSDKRETDLNDKIKTTKDQKAQNGIKSIISILNDNKADTLKSELKKPEIVQANGLSNIDTMMNFLVEIKRFHQLILTAKEFCLDFYEFNYLKLISLFKIKDNQIDLTKMTILQEHYQTRLRNHIATKSNNDPKSMTLRFSQLMCILTLLNSISESTIESLFFRETIRNLSVINLIIELFNNSSKLESFT